MSDLLSIDDNGTLTTATGASDDVFYLISPNGTVWKVTVDASTGDISWEFDVALSTPQGRVEASSSLYWGFEMENDGSLVWDRVTNPALVADSGLDQQGCDEADSAASGEGCSEASSAVVGEGCSEAFSAVGGDA